MRAAPPCAISAEVASRFLKTLLGAAAVEATFLRTRSKARMLTPMGPLETTIREKVTAEFRPQHMDLANESHMHSGPKTETHFKLLLVSEKFANLNRVSRQRLVYDLLKTEMSPGAVHALSLRLLTPDEWSTDSANTFQSPACAGGSKREGLR